MVEWLTAADPCPDCAAAAKHNDGIYTLAEAPGLILLHPNCRCAWAPYISELQRNALITTLVLAMSRSLPKKVSF